MTAVGRAGSLALMRKIRDEFEARACLAKVAVSGRSLAVWAREHGFDGRSLNIWKTNLQRRGAPRQKRTRTKPRFVEIVARPETSARYALVVGDVRIEVDDSFRADTLCRLITALRSC